MTFNDILYGKITFPDWIIPFFKIPEFVRLRGVRLSNVDSYEFKDFNGISRWEHCLGVAHLGLRCSKKMNLSKSESIHLTLACLLHDVATPPFAHTVEYVLEGYNHELESNRILSYNHSDNSNPMFPIFASQFPRFHEIAELISKQVGIKINPLQVAEMVTGGGELGFLINGSIDLDNIDNVLRATIHMGLNVDKTIAYQMVDWLSTHTNAPTNIENTDSPSFVKTWINYKNSMYSKFYQSHDEELGRQAFLQHLIRRAHDEGLSRRQIIWNTDDGLINSIEGFFENHIKTGTNNLFKYQISLKELVEQYKLLSTTFKILEIAIERKEDFKVIKSPAFTSWLAKELITTSFEPFILINEKRFKDVEQLFKNEGGTIQIFKLNNADIKMKQLPSWIQDKVQIENQKLSMSFLSTIIKKRIEEAIVEKPWLVLNTTRKENIKANLESVGNWGFILSKNESLHSYPATFVHALPATLITALGLKGELILDPFGGTAQTAAEAIKLGCQVISSDSNTIATMIASVKLSYLSIEDRKKINSLTRSLVESCIENFVPDIANIQKWHHPKTMVELSKILTFVNSESSEKLHLFYKVCFSDILTSCTARKGKEHGYFADNTPLSKNELNPPYENAIEHFLNKAKRNLSIMEKFYSYFELKGVSVVEELKNAKVFQNNIASCSLDKLDIPHGSVAGIITSPPYLCMADYTLGQRLSYYWLFPEKFQEDFNIEIAPRRNRTKKDVVIKQYLHDMKLFAKNSATLLKRDGFLVTIIGAPVANAYKNGNLLKQLDDIFSEAGLDLFWETNRKINWHRNHGYARLKEERIAVYVKNK